MNPHKDLLIETPHTGLIIAVEGLDGCGKGTQINALMDYIREQFPDRQVFYIKNPAMDAGPGILRRLLLGQPTAAIKPLTHDTYPQYEMGAAIYDPTLNPSERATPLAQRFCILTESIWTYETKMIPLLREGAILVCDRSYFVSSYIYGIGEGVPVEIMEYILATYQRFLRRPDLTLILDVPVDVSMARIAARRNQECNAYDASSRETFEVRRGLYQVLAERFKDWAVLLNGDDTPERVTENVIAAFERRIGYYLRNVHTDYPDPEPSEYDYVERGFMFFVDLMAKRIHENAVNKGFWPTTAIMKTPDGQEVEVVVERNYAEMLALATSELSEALEFLRHGNPSSDHLPAYSGVEEELSDCLIRLCDQFLAMFPESNFGRVVVDKHHFNQRRPHKHGKEF